MTHWCKARQDNVPMPAHYCRRCDLDRSEIIERDRAQQTRWKEEARRLVEGVAK